MMKDHAGERFGKLLVLSRADRYGSEAMWTCRCDCGAMKTVSGSRLRRGNTSSCGCSRGAAIAASKLRHGEARGDGSSTPEYHAWQRMLARCYRPSVGCFENYGGRGITVCERWHDSYESFLADMGRRPTSAHSVDRIDVNGSYEPGNCRWATPATQSQNRRSTVLTISRVLEIRTMASAGAGRAEIARHIGVNATTVGDVLAGRTWRVGHIATHAAPTGGGQSGEGEE